MFEFKNIKPAISWTEKYQRVAYGFNYPTAATLAGTLEGKQVALCGGGPSLKDTIPELRRLKELNPELIIATVNKTHDYLLSLDNPIRPDMAFFADPREWIPTYVTPVEGCKYVCGSQVTPELLEKLKDFDLYIFHARSTNVDAPEYLADADDYILPTIANGRSYLAVGGGTTTGLRAWGLLKADCFGSPWINFFGFDSSSEPEKPMHAYEKDSSVIHFDRRYPIRLTDPVTGKELPKHYFPNYNMLTQMRDVEKSFVLYHNDMVEGKKPPCKFVFHGYGLLPDWAALLNWHYNLDRRQDVLNGYSFFPQGETQLSLRV